MEASTRLLLGSCSPSLARRLRLRLRLPLPANPKITILPPLFSPKSRPSPRPAALAADALLFSSPRNPTKPFLSLFSPSPPPSLPSSTLHRDRADLEASNGSSSPFDRAADVAGGENLGFCVEKAGSWTVVLLGWLGAEEKHLKRYAEMYSAWGFRPVRFVVPVRETVGFDLCKSVEERIYSLATELVRWCEESERDGKEPHLIFHTFSNTGWLTYGILLQNFQSRNGIIEKIKGCIVDSAPSAEISPQVWAAGYCAALLKKRSPSLVEPVDGRKLDGRSNRLNAQDIIPALIEIIFLKVLEVFFSIILMLPYATRRLNSIISTLKDQPPYPQLYLYSSGDKVIPASVVERYIQEQKASGRTVCAHDFGSSPHVDHYRNFPHIYSAIVNEFLKHCCSTDVSKA